jgi:hypothetical protein
MVACDQPFTEVENPEFIAAMGYGRTSSKFTVPKKDGVRRRVMKLGEEVVEETKAMFLVRFSLILTCPFLIHSSKICCRPWKEKLVSLSMLGHRATAMRFWQLLLIISQMRGNAVSFQSVFIYILLILSLEELLIDFQELLGEHSGENMAAVVWSTLEKYGIQNKVCRSDIHIS